MKSEGEIRAEIDNVKPLNPLKTEKMEAPYSRLKPILIADLKDLPKRDPLIKGFLGKGEFSVFYGPPGCGKSFFIMSMALSVARGVDWYGRKVCQGLVVYIAAEGGGGIRKRLTAYCQHHGINPEGIPFAVIPTSVSLCSDNPDTEEIVSEINALEDRINIPCVMIVVDTLARALEGGDENSSKDMGAFIMNADRLREKTKAHVAAVHHTPKTEKSTPRGHSSLLGAVDVAVKVEKHPNGNSATVTKNKDDEEGWSIGFELEQIVVDQDNDGDNITSCVVIETAAPPKSKKRLTGDKLTAIEALGVALDKVGKTVKGNPNIPESVKCVSEAAWRVEFYARKIGEQDTKKKAFQRVARGLRDLGRVGIYDGRIWMVFIDNGTNGT